MVPKYGLESFIFLEGTNKQSEGSQEHMVEFLKKHDIQIFQTVNVSLNVVEKNQRRFIDVKLVKPRIEGFSVVLGSELDIPT